MSIPSATRACALAFVVACPSVNAGIIDTFAVGTGDKNATIQIDFDNGDGYIVQYAWSESARDSWSAMLEVDAALSQMSLQYDTYSFGVFLTGVTIGANTNYGQGDIEPYENYWHFWTAEAGDAGGSGASGGWSQAMFGASDRALVDGSRDAWVFGSSIAPQLVPTPGCAMALLLSGVFATRRRRPSN